MPVVYAHADAEVPDYQRRLAVFSGNLFVYVPRPSTLALAAASRMIIESTLGPDPWFAQQRLSEAEFAASFRSAGGSFTQNSVELACAAVADFGCETDRTFVSAPSLVATTGLNFLAYGLGAPQHPHRDTWYAAAPCQVNWWIPLFDLDASAALAFHPAYWDVPVRNTSSDFDYESWRAATPPGHHIGPSAALVQPRPLEPIELAPDIRISCPAGGVVISSVAQLCSVVPNETSKTLFSVQFQSASYGDIEAGHGARNVDAMPRGSALSNFVRCSDLSPIPAYLVQRDMANRGRRDGGRSWS